MKEAIFYKFFNALISVNARIYLLFGFGFFLTACQNDIQISPELLSKYHEMANPDFRADTLVPEIDCYIDYSYGMAEGMKETNIVMAKLKDFFGGRKVNYYKVGVSSIPPAVDINKPKGNFVLPDNFKEPGSKLKVALDIITYNKNKVSVFITDFERVEDASSRQKYPDAPKQHPIDPTAWAQKNFIEWLNAGNQIDIFAKLYKKPDYWFDKNHKLKYNNWIYILVFTPKAILKDSSLYKKSVVKFLEDDYQHSTDSTSQHFTYSVSNFIIGQKMTDTSVGNANDNLILRDLITNTFSKGFEYYEFTFNDLNSFNTEESQKDKRIINKIILNSQNFCFSDMQFGIKCYDVTQSLSELYNSINQEQPQVDTNIETGTKDTIANKPLKYNFKKGQEVKGVFEFVYNPDTKEIGIKLMDGFSGVAENTIYQVDVIIFSNKLKDFSTEDKVLRLNYFQNYTVNSLAESIKLALKDVAVNIENKVLYTVYIKIDK